MLSCASCYDEIGVAKSGSAKFDIICLDGHSYYKRSAGYNGYLAIKLDDNGKPVKCK